jgi:hypothetical protein
MSFSAENLAKFDTLLTNLQLEWAQIKPVAAGWLTVNAGTLGHSFDFLFRGIDELVNLAASIEAPGSDKKAIVLASANKLLQVIMDAELPVAYRPAEGLILTIFDAVLSSVIELVVRKLAPPAQA